MRKVLQFVLAFAAIAISYQLLELLSPGAGLIAPALPFTQVFTANQLGFNPLVGWQFERIPYAWMRGAVVSVRLKSTTVGNRVTASTGSTTVQERSPVKLIATAGVTPGPLDVTPLTFIASPGDQLKLAIDEVLGGTPTVDGIIEVEPL